MLKLKIKDFGPITSGVAGDGWLDLKKINVFIGPSGSGKTTVAKLIYGLSKIETNLYFNSLEAADIEDLLSSDVDLKMLNHLFSDFELEGYYSANSRIHIQSDYWSSNYHGTRRKVTLNSKTARANSTKIYIPSVRENSLNTIDSYGGEFTKDFFRILFIARSELQHTNIPFLLKNKNINFKYDENTRMSYVRVNNSEVALSQAASGIKSSLPVKLILEYVKLEISRLKASSNDSNPLALNYIEKSQLLSANDLSLYKNLQRKYVLENKTSSEARKKAALETIPEGYLAVIDEPEQSLFPESQRGLVNYLIESVKSNRKNTLILPTHSPYIVHYLGLATRAYSVVEKLKATNQLTPDILAQIDAIVPESARISIDEVRIFSFEDGAIKQLPEENGSITDDFSLNTELNRLEEDYYNLIGQLYNN